MSVSGADLGRLTPPARRGFAQALREIRDAARRRRAPSSSTAPPARWGRRWRAELAGTSTLLYVVPDEETAEARVARPRVLSAAARAGQRRSAGAAGGARAAGARRVALRRDAARPAHRSCGGWRRCSACRRGSRRACWWPRRRRCSGGCVPRAPFDALCEVIAAKATLDREATIAALRARPGSRARRWSRTRGPSPCAARSSTSSRPSTATRCASSSSATRSSRSASTTRRRSGRCARSTRSTCTRCARRSPRRAPTRAPRSWPPPTPRSIPSSKTRRLLEQIEEGEDFFGIEALAPAFHARMVPLFDYLPADALCVDRGSGGGASRRRAGRRAGCARRPPPGTSSTGWRCRRTIRARRGRGGARRWRRAGGWRSAPVEMARFDETPDGAAARADRVVAAHHAARRAARGARRARRARGRARHRQAAARSAARLARSRPARPRRRLQPDARRSAGGAAARAGARRPRSPAHGEARAICSAPAGAAAGGAGRAAAARVRAAGRSPDRRRRGGDLRRALARARRAPVKAPALGDLGEIAEGDFVVHDEHGIGRYRGLKKLDRARRAAGLPAPRVRRRRRSTCRSTASALVHRYTGAEARRRPARQAGRQDLAGEAAARLGRGAQDRRGAAAALRAARGAGRPRLPRRPTPSSARSRRPSPSRRRPIRRRPSTTVLGDMQNGVPMDRLVCGDVGYGKTEVALRAALLAVLGGKQVAVLAPTTVLAEQHFVTFSDRFSDFPVRVAVAVALPHQGRAAGDGRGARRGQDRRGRRDAPAAVARRALQATWACWSSTRSSASASPTRSGSRSCARRSTC